MPQGLSGGRLFPRCWQRRESDGDPSDRPRGGVLRALGAVAIVAPFADASSLDRGSPRSGHSDPSGLRHARGRCRQPNGTSITFLLRAQSAGIGRLVPPQSAVVYANWPEDRIDETSLCGDGPLHLSRRQGRDGTAAGNATAKCPRPSSIQPSSGGRAARFGPKGRSVPFVRGDCPARAARSLPPCSCGRPCRCDYRRARSDCTGLRKVPLSPEADRVTWRDLLSRLCRHIGHGRVELRPVDELRARGWTRVTARGAHRPQPRLPRLSALLRRVLGRRRFEHRLRPFVRGAGRRDPSFPDRAALALYSARPGLIAKAREVLGFDPVVTLTQGD